MTHKSGGNGVTKHDGEATRTWRDDGWRASCLPCLWTGPKRGTQAEAEADLREHEAEGSGAE